MATRVLLVLFALAAATAAALPVDAPATREVARAQLARLAARGFAVAWQDDIVHAEGVVARVYGLSPTGYVVVAADTDLPPVVAYSLESPYPRDDAGNPLREMIAADLAGRLAATPYVGAEFIARWRTEWDDLRDGHAQPARFQQWPPAGSTPTGGWLLTNWTQNAPYSNFCPLDIAHGGARSLAGCPAVAIAMILNYQGLIWAEFGAEDRYWHAYAGNNYWIPDAYLQYGFPNFPTLNGYLATVVQHWSGGVALTETDKAALVFASGVAATQVYSASGSGTFGVDQAFEAYERLGFPFTASLVFDGDPDLFPALALNMQQAWPAHLAVVDPGWTMGHNLVVDGYNTDGYYHLNFGWGGAYNGWYLLPQEIPYGLTVIEGVILNIVPEAVPVADEAPLASAPGRLACSPNPFNPRTVITFTAPSAGHARLAVYDLAGRLQGVLLDEAVAAGPHAITWGAEDLASGVYIAQVEVGGATATTRMVLVR